MKWKFPNGVEMTLDDFMDNGSKIQDTLKKNIEKGKTAEPMQKTMDQKLDGPARKKGVATPTKKMSSDERLRQFKKGSK